MKSLPFRILFSLFTFLFTILVTFIFSLTSIQFELLAQTILSKQASIEMLPQIEKQNSIPFVYPLFEKSGSSQVTNAYSEYDPAKYLLFSDDLGKISATPLKTTDLGKIKKTLAVEIPHDVTLVIIQRNSSEFEIYDFFEGLISSDRIKIVDARGLAGNNLWTRDHAPIPVFTSMGETKLVDAKYHGGFEPDKMISDSLKLPLLSHSYYFEGGNFIADNRGNCFVVNYGFVNQIDDALFEVKYGCKNLVRLMYINGVGHVDERVKLLSDFEAITDTPSYVPILEEHGYKVTLLPKPKGNWKTYINSLGSFSVASKAILKFKNRIRFVWVARTHYLGTRDFQN